MKKSFLLIGICIISVISANAQFKFGIGPTIGLPIGDAGDISSLTIGVELQVSLSLVIKHQALPPLVILILLGKILADLN